ncbi:uncharacterized protein LOC134697351 isoform X2 [Mytilus trossulus]|uniref:uncharacterized protein LOC134697351 isoform X2 n=1 Tax=Mytilus trossulus TaxID=6551 RepID=UPI003003E0B8
MPPNHRDVINCNYIQHEHYVRQGDFCKTCDQCFPGLGLAPFTERKFTIDPLHGALGCLHCIPCPSGFYSNHLSFEECLHCTDCRKLGVYETQNCTSKQDAVCGKIKLKSTIHDDNNYRQQNHSTNIDNNHYQLKTIDTAVISISVLCGVLAVMVIFAVYQHLRKKRRTARKQKEESKSSRGLLETESPGSSSLSSSKTTDSSPLSSSRETVETDGEENTFNSKSIVDRFIESHDCIIHNEELSEAHARMISKHIAVDNMFYDIGIDLGIQDNDIKIIIENNKDVKSRAYETLLKWKHLKASDATVLRFIDTLQRLKLHKEIREFCKTYD